jgi:hypothetical protein
MPTNACQFFYDCAACGARVKPKTGGLLSFCAIFNRLPEMAVLIATQGVVPIVSVFVVGLN